MDINNQTEMTDAVNEEKKITKQEIEALCKKILAVVLPALTIMCILLTIFNGSKEARGVKSAFKDEDCRAKIITDSDKIAELFDEWELDIKNVDEVVVAQDKDDEDVYAFVLFAKSRTDAEEILDEIQWILLDDILSGRYSAERNGKAVCFGHVDLVNAAMEELD